MQIETLLNDPLFQLNILLWMAKEQPREGYIVRPLFHELGFSIVYIESPIPLPIELMQSIKSKAVDSTASPEPELILQRAADSKALYFEAKSNSFSPQSSNAKQARGHLLASGPAFSEVLFPGHSCLLCYVVPEEKRSLMNETLGLLRRELTDAGFRTGLYSTHGLDTHENDVLYNSDATFKSFSGLDTDKVVLIRNIKEDTDPSPLFLVYTDSDYPDPERQDLARRTFQDQVHALLLCELHLLIIGETYERHIDNLLMKTTDGIFQYLGRDRQIRMRRMIRENIIKRIFLYWRDRNPDIMSLNNDTLSVRFRDSNEKDAFLSWLEDHKRTDFGAEMPPDEQSLPLLTLIEESKSNN